MFFVLFEWQVLVIQRTSEILKSCLTLIINDIVLQFLFCFVYCFDDDPKIMFTVNLLFIYFFV